MKDVLLAILICCDVSLYVKSSGLYQLKEPVSPSYTKEEVSKSDVVIPLLGIIKISLISSILASAFVFAINNLKFVIPVLFKGKNARIEPHTLLLITVTPEKACSVAGFQFVATTIKCDESNCESCVLATAIVSPVSIPSSIVCNPIVSSATCSLKT